MNWQDLKAGVVTPNKSRKRQKKRDWRSICRSSRKRNEWRNRHVSVVWPIERTSRAALAI